MYRYAIIENGVVINIIVWDGVSVWSAPAGSTVVDITNNPSAYLGDLYDGTNFTDPSGNDA